MRSPIEKTAGGNERAAFQLLDEYVQTSLAGGDNA